MHQKYHMDTSNLISKGIQSTKQNLGLKLYLQTDTCKYRVLKSLVRIRIKNHDYSAWSESVFEKKQSMFN